MHLNSKNNFHIHISRRGLYLFVLILIICMGFSLRPIPDIYSPNDTGRYINFFNLYCAGGGDVFGINDISKRFFYFIFSPTCLLGQGSFLLLVAIVPSLALLYSSSAGRKMSYWIVAFILSIYSIELMTNALRQGLGTSILLLGMAMWRRPIVATFCLLLAAASHISIFFILPFSAIWVYFSSGIISRLHLVIIGFFTSLFAFYIFRSFVSDSDSFEFYQAIYVQASNAGFLLFMVLPIIAVFMIRWLFDGVKIYDQEGIFVVYALVIIILSQMFIPAIVYRFALLMVPVQFFLILQSRYISTVGGFVAVLFFFLHTAIFTMISETFILSDLLWS